MGPDGPSEQTDSVSVNSVLDSRLQPKGRTDPAVTELNWMDKINVSWRSVGEKQQIVGLWRRRTNGTILNNVDFSAGIAGRSESEQAGTSLTIE